MSEPPIHVLTGRPVTPAHLRPSLAIDDSYKKQRRRECHNQVEKRRREHINAKIDELSELLPPTYSQNEEVVGEDDVEDDNTESPLKKKVHTLRRHRTPLTPDRRQSARVPSHRRRPCSARAGSSARVCNISSM